MIIFTMKSFEVEGLKTIIVFENLSVLRLVVSMAEDMFVIDHFQTRSHDTSQIIDLSHFYFCTHYYQFIQQSSCHYVLGLFY